MNTQHQCENGHSFFVPGQSEDSISPAVQCPECHSYRTQPTGMPDESNDMLHGLEAMPTSTEDDMSGNPLQEGMLGGWKNPQVRDESFASVRKASPEFETTGLVLPQDLYHHAMKTEAAHRTGLQLPHGITDNLHATLGNLQAWVQNPYENGELRPYYNKYWKVIRPSFSKPSSVQIGVADPTMAEIINHVAQTDDITPLYEYRGRAHESMVKMSPGAITPDMYENSQAGAAGLPIPHQDSPASALTQDLLPLLAPAGAALGLGAGAGEAAAGAGADAAGSAAAAGGEVAAPAAAAAPAAGAGAAGAGAGAGTAATGGAGLVDKLKTGIKDGLTPSNLGAGAARELGMRGLGVGLNSLDDLLGMGGGGASGGGGGAPVNPASFYARKASDEDDAFPNVHGEIPKQDDGDYHQQDDGNNHEWQRDISVDDQGGGASHTPSFQHDGPAFQTFQELLPLLKEIINSGADGSQHPDVEGLHNALESELPGYQDDPNAMGQLIMVMKSDPADQEDQGHHDENAGGKHEARHTFAQLDGDGSDFLPDLNVVLPHLSAPPAVLRGPQYPEEQALDSNNWPQAEETCPYCGYKGNMSLGMCHNCGREIYQQGGDHAQTMEYMGKVGADTQGPTTPEQIKAVQQYLIDNARELHLEGQELTDTVLNVPTNPLQYADVLAEIQKREPPPASDGLSAGPPQPAQEEAPPGDTMPVPGMDANQQMMSAIERYSADAVANVCPECGSHTTEMLDEDGNSRCHACENIFKTKGKIPVKVHNESSFRVSDDFDQAPQGVPAADQMRQRDHREEQDSGHTWTDNTGNPLAVGQEYQMYSNKYDIPDLIRIESVKPNSIVYSLTGEYGFNQSTEVTREEANIERISFEPADVGGDMPTDDSLESNDDDNTGYTGSPERTDMSAPTGLVSAGVHENQNLAWLMDGVPKTSGANFTPMEQRALIEESGEARNSGLLDLLGTHYISDADDDQFIFGL